MRNTQYAVKRLRQDSLLDWSLVKESFKTEVEKLSQFRHPNIVDLLGFSAAGESFCLIYSYMENRSLEDQLHTDGALSWPQRLCVVEGASRALQFLHRPPEPNAPLLHGDVKSSNILLDRFLVPKLADFGLARFCRGPGGGGSAGQTASVGKTATVRGTLAYLPDEYVQNGELGTAVDVYSFGVVLLEVLTGRRALETDRQSRDIYLDLVLEVEEAALWRNQLDPRLHTGGAAEPPGFMDMVALACRCLNKRRKKRPAMTEVFDELQEIHNILKKTTSCSSICGTSFAVPPDPPLHHPLQLFPRPPQSLESSIGSLSQQMSRLEPLEDTYQPLSSSSSSFSSSSSLTPPHPLHSSSSLPSSSSHSSLSSCSLSTFSSSSLSFAGPCESDESQGFSQYNAPSQFSGPTGNQYRPPSQPKGTHHRSLSPSTRQQYNSPSGSTENQPTESQYSPPCVPGGNQCNFPPQPSRTSTSGRFGSPSRAPSGGGFCTGSLRGSPARPAGTHSKPHHGVLPGRTRAGATAGTGAVEHPGAQTGSAAGTNPGTNPGTNSGNYQGAYGTQGMSQGTNQVPNQGNYQGNYQGTNHRTYQGPSPGPSAGTCPTSHPQVHQGMCGTSGAFHGNYPGPYGIPEGPSPAGSLRSSSPGSSVQMNPCKQRFLVKKTLYEEGRIQTPELLSSDDLYAVRSSEQITGPEESDELDYLPAHPNN
ncbi:interleukin-1 receptor-associated kinase 1-like isoform X2 [Centroberyx affinis]|uniref:interleukin-1 receptor-associated kinase 1-like isoform X2 n=1 Tax=Centroberyx affinis TaxID=166261 RepID=UPI003A5BE6B2